MHSAPPQGALFETQLAGGIALYDVSHLLPRHKTRRYRRRDPSAIERVYMHHSGKLGAAGYLGARNSARYRVRSTHWPGMPYHYWLPYKLDRDSRGSIVIYRCQPDNVRSWHTGGAANGHGVGVCWQGNLERQGPSDSQYELAEALVPWLWERHTLAMPEGLSYHAEAELWGGRRKAACPGPHVSGWVRAWRQPAVVA